ncbi:MAG: DUF2723 domain-containing protein, partial [Myxococcales bacterium]|nr:DUF2723 domain-containing protein [Myxococcales bacterium]
MSAAGVAPGALDRRSARDRRDRLRPPDLRWLVVPASALVCAVGAGYQLYDAGELTAAAFELGGSHPPGQPLHALVAHVLGLLPLGPYVFRVALLSVAGETLAAALTGRLCAALIAQSAGGAPDPGGALPLGGCARLAPH